MEMVGRESLGVRTYTQGLLKIKERSKTGAQLYRRNGP